MSGGMEGIARHKYWCLGLWRHGGEERYRCLGRRRHVLVSRAQVDMLETCSGDQVGVGHS